jgi:hypothetical protein
VPIGPSSSIKQIYTQVNNPHKPTPRDLMKSIVTAILWNTPAIRFDLYDTIIKIRIVLFIWHCSSSLSLLLVIKFPCLLFNIPSSSSPFAASTPSPRVYRTRHQSRPPSPTTAVATQPANRCSASHVLSPRSDTIVTSSVLVNVRIKEITILEKSIVSYNLLTFHNIFFLNSDVLKYYDLL